MMGATKRPWKIFDEFIMGANGKIVGEAVKDGDAELIVLAVNAHDELVAGLRAASKLMEGGDANWDRWHRLMDIQARRALSVPEEAEYETFSTFVEAIDLVEAIKAGGERWNCR